MKSKKYILLVVNPIAGNTEKDTIISSVEKETSTRNLRLKIYKTTGEDDEKAICNILKEETPWRILVAGGDGTISMVAECILNTDICLGIIPSGSANGLAVNFDLPPTLEGQIHVALSDFTLKIDTLTINGNLSLHIADLGINAELIENYENSGIRGKLGYFLQSIPTLFNTESPFKFFIETEEGTVEQSGILLAIANANKFGTGANINPNGRMNDGNFEILVFKSLDFIEILKTAQDNPQLSSDFVHAISTKRAKITTKGEVPFQIDGEYIGKTSEVSVSIERESLAIAVPEMFFNLQSQKQ